jgi:hypothetical protein
MLRFGVMGYLPHGPSSAQNRWQALVELPFQANNLISTIMSAQVECWEKIRLPSLLRETDFAHQLGVARIGAQGIEPGVAPETVQLEVVFAVCGVEPLERMIFVA